MPSTIRIEATASGVIIRKASRLDTATLCARGGSRLAGQRATVALPKTWAGLCPVVSVAPHYCGQVNPVDVCTYLLGWLNVPVYRSITIVI